MNGEIEMVVGKRQKTENLPMQQQKETTKTTPATKGEEGN